MSNNASASNVISVSASPTTPASPGRRSSPVTHTRCSVHGVPTSIRSYTPSLAGAIQRAMGEFAIAASSFPEGSPSAIDGTLRPYEQNEVVRHLSPHATPIPSPRDGLEIYQDGERYWLIDDRWGLCEINLLKGHWRSWILEEPTIDADSIVELAVIWPFAQLLRSRGLCLLPAVSVMRGEPESANHLGMLILSPFSIEPEIAALVRAGFRVVGQRWTVLRDDNGTVTAARMPGRVERNQLPRLRAADSSNEVAPASMLPSSDELSRWVDLESEFCGCAIASGAIDTIMLIEPGRRPTSSLRAIAASSALPALRHAWPIVELHPHRVGGQFPVKLSRRCRTYAMRLSHRPQDLLDSFEAYRSAEQRERSERAAIRATTAMIDTLAG